MKNSIIITLAAFMFASTAMAQDTLDAHGFYVAPNDGELLDPVSVFKVGSNEVNSFGAQALLEKAKRPAVLYRRTAGFDVADEEVLLEDLTALNLSAFYAPDERVFVGAAAPVYLDVDGAGKQTGAALGDTRLMGSVGLVLPDNDAGFGLSVVPYLDVPGLYDEQNLGLTGVAGGGLVAASIGEDNWNVSGNVGVEFTPNVEVYNLDGGERLVAGLAAGYAFDENVALRAETTFRPNLDKNDYLWTASPAEGILSLRGHSGRSIDWTMGAAKGFNKGFSAADWRVFAGVGIAFGTRDSHECEACEPQVIVQENTVYETQRVYVIPPVYFDFDKADIKFPESEATLEILASILLQDPNLIVGILGHTDDRGSDSYNEELANRRVQAVIDHLVEKYNIDPSRLYPRGFGEEWAEGCGVDEKCHQIDRRVDFMIQ